MCYALEELNLKVATWATVIDTIIYEVIYDYFAEEHEAVIETNRRLMCINWNKYNCKYITNKKIEKCSSE